MFAKLLKHEWRATRGMLGILCLIALGASLLGGVTMCYLTYAGTHVNVGNDTLEIISVLFMMAAMIAMAIVGVAAVVLYLGRFYKSRFTDEGYLTFTLPVSTHQNLLASLVNTVIGTVLITLVICACGALWLAIAFAGVKDFYQSLWQNFPELWERGWQSLRELLGQIPGSIPVRMVLSAVIGGVSSLVMLMLAVTVGSIAAKKHKILAAVGVYYGIQVLISLVSAFTLAAVETVGTGTLAMLGDLLNRGVVISLVLGVGGYFLMYWLVDRKLNLN